MNTMTHSNNTSSLLSTELLIVIKLRWHRDSLMDKWFKFMGLFISQAGGEEELGVVW